MLCDYGSCIFNREAIGIGRNFSKNPPIESVWGFGELVGVMVHCLAAIAAQFGIALYLAGVENRHC